MQLRKLDFMPFPTTTIARGITILLLPELVLSCQLELTVWCIFGATGFWQIAKHIQHKRLIWVGHHVANVS